MSYCRFSNESDVYVYRHVAGGWRIHVAEYRIDRHETKKISGVHDGEAFDCATHQETIDRLVDLREGGYVVPEHALNRLREELGLALPTPVSESPQPQPTKKESATMTVYINLTAEESAALDADAPAPDRLELVIAVCRRARTLARLTGGPVTLVHVNGHHVATFKPEHGTDG